MSLCWSVLRVSSRCCPKLSGGREWSLSMPALLPHCTGTGIFLQTPKHYQYQCTRQTSNVPHRELEIKEFTVNPFGTLSVCSPYDVTISSIDPLDYPDGNRSFVIVNKKSDMMESRSHQYKLGVKHDETRGITVYCDHNVTDVHDSNHDVQLVIRVPVKYDINASMMKKGNITIHNMENEKCQITTENGNCSLTNIKCTDLDVRSSHGDFLNTKTLQANGEICLQGSGCFDAEKLYGMNMKAATEQGSISVKAVYHNKSEFTSNNGNIRLGNLHGSSNVSSCHGNITIDTLDGDMTASTINGNIDVHITRHGQVSLANKNGNILVKLSESANTELDLQAKEINIDNKLNVLKTKEDNDAKIKLLKGSIGHSDGQLLKVTSEGVLDIKCQSWFESLNLTKS
ncbi:protein FAM185A-like [Saccoglossus kowalevskii]|uniref:Protein FAM185A-like n=1 Tax=Saccoglossus kowalevskii TaxID=10224 RepID=A0ABM0GYM3_SACKO|nr:PREDICTED: protein FAM185A-like [Saccoglossus kowalevskii]